MKLKVEGIEEIEITDPKGLCNPPVQQGIPIQQQPSPVQPQYQVWPTPQIPSHLAPIPGTLGPRGDVVVNRPIYTRLGGVNNDPLLRTKWGVGTPMIQEAAQQTDPDKWEKNWQSAVGVRW